MEHSEGKREQAFSGASKVHSSLGFAAVILLGWAAWHITRQVYGMKLPLGIPGKALEYPLWAALIGIVAGQLLRLNRHFELLRQGFRSELFLKVGLVLLGAGISFSTLKAAAAPALVQALVMITSVFCFSWWLSGKLGLEEKLRAVMSTAVSVCGVSAAIAAAGAVLARKEEVTFVSALVILVALPLMVLAPALASYMGLSQSVAGAWFGGNIDTTAAVVGAGTIYGLDAQQIATIVKSVQNALIGVVTFLLALYFVVVVERSADCRPSILLIWERFPKFVVGFIAASALYSVGWIDGGKGSQIEALKNWCFLFAFVGMGLELSFRELQRMGWRPYCVFFVVTLFNTVWGLLVAKLLFA